MFSDYNAYGKITAVRISKDLCTCQVDSAVGCAVKFKHLTTADRGIEYTCLNRILGDRNSNGRITAIRIGEELCTCQVGSAVGCAVKFKHLTTADRGIEYACL